MRGLLRLIQRTEDAAEAGRIWNTQAPCLPGLEEHLQSLASKGPDHARKVVPYGVAVQFDYSASLSSAFGIG